MTITAPLRRLVVALLALALALAGCGDDGDGDTQVADDGSPSDDDGAATDGDATDDSAPAGDGDGAGAAPSEEVGAVVTIGDLEYVLPERDSCISTPRAINADFSDGPDNDIRLELELPPFDWETDTASTWDPPSLGLTDRTGEGRRSYHAAPSVAERYPDTDAPMAVITDYQLGDGWATGSGFVIDTQGLVDAEAQGTEPPTALPLTFAVVCEI